MVKRIYTIIAICLFVAPAVSFAGNISAPNNMAWSDELGWINMAPDNGNTTVTDTALTGYIWSATAGWINLNPSNGGVVNDGSGNLSGKAWASGAGWIDFAGVTISPSTGVFSGTTVPSALAGTITFSCTNCSVITSWRPGGSTPPDPGGGGSSGGGSSSGGSGTFIYPPVVVPQTPPDSSLVIPGIVAARQPASIYDALYDLLVPNILKPKPKEPPPFNINDFVKKVPPTVLGGLWNIFPHQRTDQYVLAPLPREIHNLAVKFPTLNGILTDVGVTKITDLEKLRSTNISLPNISEVDKLPSEIVFAGNGLLNLSSTIQVSDVGDVQQKIETVVNKPIKLSVKPIAAADSVTGILAFKSRPANVTAEIPTDSLFASALMALLPTSNRVVASADTVEKQLVVSNFEYADPDHDGVYTAEIQAPQTEGEYEVITLIKYRDPELGTKEMRLVTIVDPEGYVYETLGPLEARVPDVKVSLYKGDALWDAKSYNQSNPQITDKTGKYAFLVPEGEYYVVAESDGYKKYVGESFNVREGKGVHFNIQLERTNSWLRNVFDWKVILILILGAALVLNFWYEKRMFRKLLLRQDVHN